MRNLALENLIYARKQLAESSAALVQMRGELDEVMRKSGLEAARPLHDILVRQRDAFLTLLQDCRRWLLEIDHEAAEPIKQLCSILDRFPVMAADYMPLQNAVAKILAQFPEEAETLAGLGHLANSVKMGYYPTDPRHVEWIRNALTFPDSDVRVNLFDPCCGEGLALRQLGHGASARTYGAELDENRARCAGDNLDCVALGSFFSSHIAKNAFHLVFLNPPYLSVAMEKRIREEKRFLMEAYSCCMPGGVLVYIIPFYRLTPDIAQILAENFDALSIYRFSGPEFKKFRQIAVIGRRTVWHEDHEKTAWLLKCADDVSTLPELSEIGKNKYALPAKAADVKPFHGEVFNEYELYRQLQESPSLRKLYSGDSVVRRDKRPLLPLNAGQIGLIGGSGLLDGRVECEVPHIIRGVIERETITEVSVTRRDKKGNAKTLLQTETNTNKLVFNILTQNGFVSLA